MGLPSIGQCVNPILIGWALIYNFYMINLTIASEVVGDTSSEISKKDLADRVYKDLTANKETCEGILSRVKWSLDFQKRIGNDIPWSPEAIKERISGNLIGFIAETVSEKIPLLDAQTVFNPGKIPLESLKVVSPQEFAGSDSNKKGDVLAHMLRKSFEEKPLKMFDPNIRLKNNPVIGMFKEERRKSGAPQVPSQEYGRQLREYMVRMKEEMEEETIKSYAYGEVKEKDGSVTPAGEFFGQTAISDGIVIKEGEPVGIFEVKAYKAEELDKAMLLIRKSGKEATYFKGTAADFGKKYPGADKEQYNIGADIDKEVAFVDILRGLTGKGTDMGADNLVLLRFPNDIPDNLLTQYGEMVVSYGFTNVVIQKLPFSREELEIIAKEVIKSRWSILNFQLLKGNNFANRDLNVLHEYANSEE